MTDVIPTSITRYDRTKPELEQFWLFAIIVAGKPSNWAARKVSDLLRKLPEGRGPIEWLNEGNGLHNTLVANRVGQYARIERAIRQSATVDLVNGTVEELESVFGVGPKTVRFFLLHTRPGIKVAVLDTHILKWLRNQASWEKIPHATPTDAKQYLKLERLWITLAESNYPHLTLAEADLLIWAAESGRLDDMTPPFWTGEFNATGDLNAFAP